MKLSVGEMVVRSRAGPFSHTYTHMAHLYSVHRELDVLDRQAVPVQMALGWHSEVCVSQCVCVPALCRYGCQRELILDSSLRMIQRGHIYFSS